MPSPVEAMERMERSYWGTFNELRIVSTNRRFRTTPPSYQDLLKGWVLYTKTKVLEGAYDALSNGNKEVYKPNQPALHALAKARRQSSSQARVDEALAIFHQDIFGIGEKGKATYLGKIRGARRQGATNFYYAMEALLKEEVVSVAPETYTLAGERV